MDFFWTWFYQQLEKQPKEDVNLLKQAAEEALETPVGMEPRRSAQLLQSRIGNQAMQRLLAWKSQRKARERTGSETEPAAGVVETEQEAVLSKRTLDEPSVEKGQTLDGVVQEALSGATTQTEKEKEAPDSTPIVSVEGPTPAIEEKTALALHRFLGTLNDGGHSREWHALAALFKEMDNATREKVINGLTAALQQIEQTAQQLFMTHLLDWKENGDDDLAMRLWLRLRFLASAWAPAADNNGGGPVD